ncbi:metal-dependent hydrolase [uncultured Tateyamaria sp.]|uniref:metal-dependent hydrolase n=1 Tax=uncultured Tateyamaria sp. TaxID=455651 RepID=UPI00261428E0|nr:metal-dependent hydrolase [uncultured Tateyamaria sp.]
MHIIWLGHGSFRIEIEDQVILLDPWFSGNPMLSDDQAAQAVRGATHILLTHGHFDHTTDVAEISRENGLPVSAIYELAAHLTSQGAVEGNGFNMGGTVYVGEVAITMVPASHSSSMQVDGRGVYMGQEAGFILKGEGKVIYASGDTGIMADMEWIGHYHKPQIGILCAGGYFTMDMAGAAYAAKRYFDFDTVIPCHYRTFPLLEQSAEVLAAGLPGVNVIEPQVMEAIAL